MIVVATVAVVAEVYVNVMEEPNVWRFEQPLYWFIHVPAVIAT